MLRLCSVQAFFLSFLCQDKKGKPKTEKLPTFTSVIPIAIRRTTQTHISPKKPTASTGSWSAAGFRLLGESEAVE